MAHKRCCFSHTNSVVYMEGHVVTKKKRNEKRQMCARTIMKIKKKTCSRPINAVETGENFWFVLTLSENYTETSFTKLCYKCPSEMMKARLSFFFAVKLIKHQKTR